MTKLNSQTKMTKSFSQKITISNLECTEVLYANEIFWLGIFPKSIGFVCKGQKLKLGYGLRYVTISV